MDVFEAIHSRRSIRRYLPDPVDRALMEELRHVDAGRKFTREEMNERR